MHPTRKLKNEAELLELWNEFKAWKKQQAKFVPALNQKTGEVINVLHELPLTIDSFLVWSVNYKGWGIGSLDNYIDNSGDLYNDFKVICSRIKNEIREHQIIGGMNGFFNASITQRLNGLADKKELDVKGEPRIFNL